MKRVIDDYPDAEVYPTCYYEKIKVLCIKDFSTPDRYTVSGKYVGPGSNFKEGEYYDGIYLINKANGSDEITIYGVECAFGYDKKRFYFDKNEIKCNERIELIDKMLNECDR